MLPLDPDRSRGARILHSESRKDFTEKIRKRIEAVALLERLQNFALSRPDPDTGEPVLMTQTEAMVALKIVDKVIPNVPSIDLGDDAATITFVVNK